MSSFIQVGPKLCSLEEKLRMASTAKPSSTRALLDGGNDDVLLHSRGAEIVIAGRGA